MYQLLNIVDELPIKQEERCLDFLNVFLIGVLKDLRGIDLSGFSTVEAELLELNDVLYDSTTKWPEGFTPPA